MGRKRWCRHQFFRSTVARPERFIEDGSGKRINGRPGEGAISRSEKMSNGPTVGEVARSVLSGTTHAGYRRCRAQTERRLPSMPALPAIVLLYLAVQPSVCRVRRAQRWRKPPWRRAHPPPRGTRAEFFHAANGALAEGSRAHGDIEHRQFRFEAVRTLASADGGSWMLGGGWTPSTFRAARPHSGTLNALALSFGDLAAQRSLVAARRNRSRSRISRTSTPAT